MIHQLEDINSDLNISCDVCVVGTGAGGAVVGKTLAEAGLHVVMIEEGGYFPPHSYLADDTVQSLVNLYRNAGAAVIFGKPNIMYAEGRCVGGSTTVNGGMCWRTPEKIMKIWRWEKGITHFSPQKMDYYFSEVEKNINAKSMIPEAVNRESELLKLGGERLGYEVKANIRAQDHCVGANLCITGCPTQAKQTMVTSYIPAFLKKNGDIYTHCRVHRVLTRQNRAVGVEGYFTDPVTKQKKYKLKVKSRIVISSCGAIQTPALLLKSGIKDNKKLLGKNLITHPNAKVMAVFDEPVNSWRGVNQGYQITEFFDDGILMAVNSTSPGVMTLALPLETKNILQALKNEFHHLVMGGVLIEDSSRGQVRTGPFDTVFPLYNLNSHDFEKTLRGVGLLAEVFFTAGAKKCYLPFRGLQEMHSIDDIPKIYQAGFKPTDVELLTVHVMGTAQMGGDPDRSVINPFGEFHNIKGLYVADASVFPTSIGVNPQVTIMALAMRTAEHITENFNKLLT
ncbi:MAG: GMC family oxidoreductase [Deltaproteobacteria bacterium]|nr:GMC family oxidoreductase [Deltaproteobacteria bacterium]